MGLFSTFDISAAGMAAERLRLDVSATNLANVHTSRGSDGNVYQPMRVVTTPIQRFDALVADFAGNGSVAPFQMHVEPTGAAPRLVFDPGHPDADTKGFVAYPDVNPVSEMVNLIGVSRAYEANVRAMNIAKTMALKALDIGGDR